MIFPYLYILLSTFFYFVSNYNSTKMAHKIFLIIPRQKFYSNFLLEEYKLDKN